MSHTSHMHAVEVGAGLTPAAAAKQGLEVCVVKRECDFTAPAFSAHWQMASPLNFVDEALPRRAICQSDVQIAVRMQTRQQTRGQPSSNSVTNPLMVSPGDAGTSTSDDALSLMPSAPPPAPLHAVPACTVSPTSQAHLHIMHHMGHMKCGHRDHLHVAPSAITRACTRLIDSVRTLDSLVAEHRREHGSGSGSAAGNAVDAVVAAANDYNDGDGDGDALPLLMHKSKKDFSMLMRDIIEPMYGDNGNKRGPVGTIKIASQHSKIELEFRSALPPSK